MWCFYLGQVEVPIPIGGISKMRTRQMSNTTYNQEHLDILS